MLLISCSTTSKLKVENKVVVPIVCSNAPTADVITTYTIDPTLVTDSGKKTWVAVSLDDYKKLSKNLQSILKHLRQKNAILDYYRECIFSYNNKQKDDGKQKSK